MICSIFIDFISKIVRNVVKVVIIGLLRDVRELLEELEHDSIGRPINRFAAKAMEQWRKGLKIGRPESDLKRVRSMNVGN